MAFDDRGVSARDDDRRAVGSARHRSAYRSSSDNGSIPCAQVKVTLTNGSRTFTRLVRASSSGGFTVRFTLAAVDPCRGTLSVSATDGRGSTARWKRQCRPPSETDPYPVS